MRDLIVSYCFEQYFGFKKQFMKYQKKELRNILTNAYIMIHKAPKEYKQKYYTTKVVKRNNEFTNLDESMNL